MIADHEFYNAIYNRIMNRHPELVDKYGPVNLWGTVDRAKAYGILHKVRKEAA